MTKDEIKVELAALGETVTAGFARTDGEMAALRETMMAGFARAAAETAALRETMTAGFVGAAAETAVLRETMTAGFARVDHYFELQQVQFIEFRDQVIDELGEIRSRLDGLNARVDRIERELQSLRSEYSAFRDWVTREFAEVHSELRELRQVGVAQSAEIQQLSVRVDRLEDRWNGLGGAQAGSTT